MEIFITFLGLVGFFEYHNSKEVSKPVILENVRYQKIQVCKPSNNNCMQKVDVCKDTETGKFAKLSKCEE